MKTLRDYERIIKNTVSEIDNKDENWGWSYRFAGDDLVEIRWSYLDGETNDCFFLKLDQKSNLMTARNPENLMIEGIPVSDDELKFAWQESYEYAVSYLIRHIAKWAGIMY